MNEEIVVHPVNRRRWFIHLCLLVAYILPNIFFANRIHHRPALTNNSRGFIFVCAVELLIFSIVLGLAWLASRASADDLLLRWRPGWWVVPIGLGYSVAIRIATGITFFLIFMVLLGSGIIKPESIQQTVESARPAVERLIDIHALETDPTYYWLTVTFGSFVVAGLREEIWRSATLAAFRVLWPRLFGSLQGQIGAVSLIAVGFGAAHLPMGVLAAVGAGILGCLLGIIMVVHKSIWPAVIAHGAFDALTFALLPYMMGKVH